jgi:hypothetical protein
MIAEIVPLTHEHMRQWFGDIGGVPTVKGIAGFVDGNLVAVAGFRILRGEVLAFCGLKDEARPFKKTMHQTALHLMAEAKQRHKRILAKCDPDEPTAPAWLRRLGFTHEEGDLWVWLTSE